MKDQNVYTKLIFTFGLSGLPLFIYAIAGVPNWSLLLWIIGITILYELMQIQLPNGQYYSINTVGSIYLLYQYGPIQATVPALIGVLTFFLLHSKSLIKINWFRLITSYGMLIISAIIAWFIEKVLDTPYLFFNVFILVIAFDGVNLFLKKALVKSIRGGPLFQIPTPQAIFNFMLPVFVLGLVVVQLSLSESFGMWLWNLGLTSFFVMIIFYLTSSYSKQVDTVKESSQRLRSLYENNPDIVMTVDTQGLIIESNPMLDRVLGFRRETILGQSIFNLVDHSVRDELREAYKKHSMDIPVTVEVPILHADGTSREFFVTLVPTILNNNVVGSYIIGKDITAEKNAERLTERMAYFDSITGLPNRIHFMDQLHREMRKCDNAEQSICVLFIDFDQFKSINDTYGHSTGDLVLVNAAQRICEVIPDNAFAARLGGDEFIVIQPGGSIEDGSCFTLAQQLIDVFQDPLILGENVLFISPSIGISMYPKHAYSAEKLINQADAAMYRVKDGGGNGYCAFTPDMEDEQQRNQLMSMLLRRCLENNELYIQYQPLLDVKTGKISGAEALLRWNNPVLGNVSPGEFIPLAEQNRLILPIGTWILNTACKQNKAWQDAGHPPIKVAVNISSIQLQQDDFLDIVKNALQESQLDPQWLELELTEGVLIQNTDRNLHILNELRELGVNISVDDFGTGYSSLSYLNRFPIHNLKIDRSFIQNIGISPSDQAIIRTIIKLAKELKMEIVAEGVELEEQLEFIKAEGCDYIQGYYVSKPLPAEDFAKKVWH